MFSIQLVLAVFTTIQLEISLAHAMDIRATSTLIALLVDVQLTARSLALVREVLHGAILNSTLAICTLFINNYLVSIFARPTVTIVRQLAVFARCQVLMHSIAVAKVASEVMVTPVSMLMSAARTFTIAASDLLVRILSEDFCVLSTFVPWDTTVPLSPPARILSHLFLAHAILDFKETVMFVQILTNAHQKFTVVGLQLHLLYRPKIQSSLANTELLVTSTVFNSQNQLFASTQLDRTLASALRDSLGTDEVAKT
jgi:hypothetical protein